VTDKPLTIDLDIFGVRVLTPEMATQIVGDDVSNLIMAEPNDKPVRIPVIHDACVRPAYYLKRELAPGDVLSHRDVEFDDGRPTSEGMLVFCQACDAPVAPPYIIGRGTYECGTAPRHPLLDMKES
jgi:hypothetical protein